MAKRRDNSGRTLIQVVDGSAGAELQRPAREFLDYGQGMGGDLAR